MKSKYSIVILITLFCFLCKSLEAQYNFKVGIGSKYVLAPTHNLLVGQYNEDNKDLGIFLEQPLDDLNFVNGVHLGIRRKTDLISYEISWEYLSSKSYTYGEDTSGNLFEQTLYYTIIDTYFGIEYESSDLFSYGLTLGPRNMRIRRDIGNSDSKINMTKNGNPQWTSKLYGQVTLGGRGTIGFALRPYFEFAWNKLNLSNIRDDFNINYSGNTSDSFHSFGVTLLFYNGPQ